jgi:hypothetical protein
MSLWLRHCVRHKKSADASRTNFLIANLESYQYYQCYQLIKRENIQVSVLAQLQIYYSPLESSLSMYSIVISIGLEKSKTNFCENIKFRFSKNPTELRSADIMLHNTPLKKDHIHTLRKIIVYLHYMQQCKLFSLFSNVAISCNILPDRQVTDTTCRCHCFNSIIYI